jgi:phage terminase large subunit
VEEEIVDRRYVAYGAASDFMAYKGLEALCESGAGTGKSFSLMQKANWTARAYPDCRQLFARQTRKSLNISILPDWRNNVLFRAHPACSRTASLEHQDCYRYPNGATIDVLGLENIERVLSAQYDRIYIFQAEETSVDVWEKLITRLRYGKTPYHQIVADVNPAGEFHWLNIRGDEYRCSNPDCKDITRIPDSTDPRRECSQCGGVMTKTMQRFRYRHEDNPRWFDHETREWTEEGIFYVGQALGALKGVRRERLLHHRWVSEEGIILEEYEPEIHMISGELEHNTNINKTYLHVLEWEEPVELQYFTAGVDWGYWPDPGVISVWGYDNHKPEPRAFRVAEVYRTHWQLEEWADCAEALWREFRIRFFACDPSRPDCIQALNTRMGGKSGRGAPAVAIKADNAWESGIDLIRWGLRDPLTKEVHTYFLRDALRHGRDEELARAGRPVCTEQEIHSYVYLKTDDGRPNKEQADPVCDEHGIDAWRYNAKLNWKRNFSRKPPKQEWAPNSYGALFDKMMKKKKMEAPGFHLPGARRRGKSREPFQWKR